MFARQKKSALDDHPTHLLFRGLPSPESARYVPLIQFCEDHKDQVLASLPWLVAEITDQSDFHLMINLVLARSGSRIYQHDLRRECAKRGVTITDKVMDRLLAMNNGTDRFELPSAWGVFSTLRRLAILCDLRGGTPLATIARNYGVSLRYLRSLKKR